MRAVLDGELRASQLLPQNPVARRDGAREEEVPPSTARRRLGNDAGPASVAGRVEARPKSEARRVLLQQEEEVRQVVLLDAEAATEAGAVVQAIQVDSMNHAHHRIPGPAWRWWFH